MGCDMAILMCESMVPYMQKMWINVKKRRYWPWHKLLKLCLQIYMCISITCWGAAHLVFGRFSSLTEIAFVIFHRRNSSFSLMKKFAQLLPTTARADNQFINISNPDPFTLLKLISTKYVFPNHVHKFQSLSNFSASQIWWNQPPNLFGWKKKLFHSKLSWWRIYWVNVNWKYRFSVSLVALSLIFVLENSKADPEA